MSWAFRLADWMADNGAWTTGEGYRRGKWNVDMDTIRFGKHKIIAEFGVANEHGDDKLLLTSWRNQTMQETVDPATPENIADGVRNLVERVAADEQVTINRKRTIEDARRLLGG